MRRSEHVGRVFWFAVERTLHDVVGQTRGQRAARGLVFIATLALAYAYVRLVNQHSQAFSGAVKAALLASAAIVIVGGVVFAYHFLWEGPYQVALAERRRAEELEQVDSPSAPLVLDRTSLLDACLYMIEHRWEVHEDVLEVPDQISMLPNKLHELRQAAYEEAITIWGQSSEWSPLQLRIPADEWANSRVEWFSFTKGNARTEGGLSVWYNLQVSKAEIERLMSGRAKNG